MPMNEVIQRRRKALGLTQEQVAERLCVSTPAVSKWESGTTCPDLALLPALARLLQTDPNDLLCFHADLSREELEEFCRRLSEIQDLPKAFDAAREKIRAYPTNEQLRLNCALLLNSRLVLQAASADAEEIRTTVDDWLQMSSNSADAVISDPALYVLASRRASEEDWEGARDALARMSPQNGTIEQVDRVFMQVAVDRHAGHEEQALRSLQQATLFLATRLQMMLNTLASIRKEEGKTADMLQISEKAVRLVKLMDLPPIGSDAVALKIAAENQDRNQVLTALHRLRENVGSSWDLSESPLYDQLPRTAFGDPGHLFRWLPDQLEKDPVLAFLREDPEFQTLLRSFRDPDEPASSGI